jgi:hypothetical protein
MSPIPGDASIGAGPTGQAIKQLPDEIESAANSILDNMIQQGIDAGEAQVVNILRVRVAVRYWI